MDSSSPSPPDLPPAKIPFDAAQRSSEDHDFPKRNDIHNPQRLRCKKCEKWIQFTHYASGTDPLCEECRSTHAQEELNEMRARMCQDFSVKLQAAASERMPLQHIEAFLAELVYDFGGMQVFVKCWSDQLKIAFERSPGHFKNLDQCRSIAKLIMETNKLQHQENVLDLSDEQLRVKKELAILQMLSDAAGDPHRRHLLVELLRTNGIALNEIPGLPGTVEVASGAT